MKKYISSAVSIDDIHNGAFSSLANSAYNEGYDLNITEDMQMTLVARSLDKIAAPTITIKTVNTDGVYTFQATMSFPTLAYKDFDYFDDFQYYLKEWGRLADFFTKLNRFYYNPTEWIDE